MPKEFVCPILSKHIGQIVSLRGIVTAAGSSQVGVETAVWVCEVCGARSKVRNEIPYGPPSKPKSCEKEEDGCGRKDTFILDELTSKYLDYRRLVIQFGTNEQYYDYKTEDKIEIILCDLETEVKRGDMVELDASIRAKESKNLGHTVVPYGFTDSITVKGPSQHEISIYHHSVILPKSNDSPDEKNHD